MTDKDIELLREGELAGQFPDDAEIEENEEDNTPAYSAEKIQMVKMINNRIEALGDWLAGIINEKEYQEVCFNNRFQKIPTRPITIGHQALGETEEKVEYIFSAEPELAKKEKDNLRYWHDTLSFAARNWSFLS